MVKGGIIALSITGYAKSYPDADTGLIRRFSGLEDMKLSSDQVAASA
jgi:hypothetical protein